jgi:hypothetical protein
MHFIRLEGIPPAATVSYQLASGSPSAVWSTPAEFRAPFGPTDVAAKGRRPGETWIALFGDMVGDSPVVMLSIRSVPHRWSQSA